MQNSFFSGWMGGRWSLRRREIQFDRFVEAGGKTAHGFVEFADRGVSVLSGRVAAEDDVIVLLRSGPARFRKICEKDRAEAK